MGSPPRSDGATSSNLFFYDTWFPKGKEGLGSMSGPRENSEKFNKKITQPLKRCLYLGGYRALLKHVIEHFSSTYKAFSSISQTRKEHWMSVRNTQAFMKHFSSIFEAFLKNL
jgi:hypothetical protein